jgi:hypothetical protein
MNPRTCARCYVVVKEPCRSEEGIAACLNLKPLMAVACTFDQFKVMSKEFFNSYSTLNLEGLGRAWSYLTTGYLNMVGTDNEKYQAALLLKIASCYFILHEVELGKEVTS